MLRVLAILVPPTFNRVLAASHSVPVGRCEDQSPDYDACVEGGDGYFAPVHLR